MTTLVALLCACQNGRCFYCDAPFSGPPRSGRKRRGSQWSRDHLWPKVCGGKSTRNIVLACLACNTSKSDRPPTQNEIDRASDLFAHVRALGQLVAGGEFWEARHWPKPMRPFQWPRTGRTADASGIAASGIPCA